MVINLREITLKLEESIRQKFKKFIARIEFYGKNEIQLTIKKVDSNQTYLRMIRRNRDVDERSVRLSFLTPEFFPGRYNYTENN